ncbi:MBL fold metallo-hydrolase [Alkalihalobacillus oceani]|uniref:MBL fold metallo-hydrolase n=1 Tax=Halalkalibacter oceani TaxID=1653776 RepID=A0A9X2DPY9_9BACI|nr:MBL fold metallo-hydrolase [Halalkalibacter oceani]MCM3714000.1 MBL fold metallo-hydrolase [Halalkalibacter oceani]
MRITVLGGGNEIGASCLHVEIEGTAVLIDAGMRIHGEHLLPALGLLEELSRPKAILVTHAHADHIGALPLVHALFPEVPVYATAPTIALMRIMMKDSLKIIEQKSQAESSVPPYSFEQVERLLDAMLTIPASDCLRIGELDIQVFQAGHILGAVMFLFQSRQAELLITGDISFKDGRTITGAKVTHTLQPDVVVMESTYGNRTHVDRHTEEKRLVDHVAEVIGNGGFALVPAFALGRAQEVLLILQDYMDRGLIPEFPIYVDGLVTPISGVYKQYPQYLKGVLAHRINREGDVFLKEGRCHAVQAKDRERIIQGKPACIVASSGMLTGGASSWYAERLVSSEKNAILLTGYQDEESPGQALLHVAEGLKNELTINGSVYQVKAQIGKYGLSAHADAHEMTMFIQKLAPAHTLLVHGDDDARLTLQSMLNDRYNPITVENGQTYTFDIKREKRKEKKKRSVINREQEKICQWQGQFLVYKQEDDEKSKVALCTGVNVKSGIIFGQTLKGKTIRLYTSQVIQALGKTTRMMEEISLRLNKVLEFSLPIITALRWEKVEEGTYTFEGLYNRVQQEDSMEERLALTLCLQTIDEQHKRVGTDGVIQYRIVDDFIHAAAKGELPVQGRKMNGTKALELIKAELREHKGFIRCGMDDLGTEEERLTLYFAFPDAISQLEQKKLCEEFESKTGWSIVISDSVRQDLLPQVVSELTVGADISQTSILLQEKKFIVTFSIDVEIERIQEEFFRRTGFTLEEKGRNKASLSTSTAVFLPNTPSKRMENNQAIEETKRWAEQRGIKVYKISFKGQGPETILEVHFISPEVAARHEVDLEELSYRTGFPVTYAKAPKQNEILHRALKLIPESWLLKKTPSIHVDRACLGVKVGYTPDPEEVEQINKGLLDETGYSLEIK